ncbi:MAG TPA: GNAT family N-acetyltransferase [Acidimicrobiia bacterium]|nr:GNAT family N-acetyltransferase [Acidimicrobiia bacterium]
MGKGAHIIREATPEDVTGLVRCLNEAINRKLEKNDDFWGEHSFTESEVEKAIAGGDVFVVIDEANNILGTFRLTHSDEKIWGPDGIDDSSAFYLHRLATTDAASGTGVGENVIDWISQKAIIEGRNRIRLDVSYTLPGLCRYYEKLGFVKIKAGNITISGTRNPNLTIYPVAFFERSVDGGVVR